MSSESWELGGADLFVGVTKREEAELGSLLDVTLGFVFAFAVLWRLDGGPAVIDDLSNLRIAFLRCELESGRVRIRIDTRERGRLGFAITWIFKDCSGRVGIL